MLPKSCDTFVIMPPFTKTGDVIFGKNADRPRDEVQEVVFIKGGIRESSTLKCTYITIEQATEPVNDVILSKPAWMWGAEMGANNKNVAVGNEAVWTKHNTGNGDPNVKRLLGTDLVRLGLERGSTAIETLEVITSLLELYGQGGPCSEYDIDIVNYHNSFLIADPLQAWVLETSGDLWVARKIESGWTNISNGLTIRTEFDRHCHNLRERTQTLGLWDGQSEFDFAACFSNGVPEPRQAEGETLLRESSVGFDVRDMVNILRNKNTNICRTREDIFPTQGSQVSSLSAEVSVHWFTGTCNPSISFFKPFIFTTNPQASTHTMNLGELGRKHLLYRLHEDCQEKGNMEAACLRFSEMESRFFKELEFIGSKIINGETSLDEFDELFKYCVESEVKIYLPDE